MKPTLTLLAALLLAPLAVAHVQGADQPGVAPSAAMPRAGDYALMWWADGFPAHTPAAPWLRVIRTGHYALALDTETLRIPHFGAVPGGVSYLAATHAGDGDWRSLPPAELNLSIHADGKAYRCTAGGKWTQFTGPRLIESGRFVQRADITDLVFTAEDGEKLDVDARIETVAWPDRLAIILAARDVPHDAETKREGVTMELALTTAKGTLRRQWQLPPGRTWNATDWHEVSLALDPVTFQAVEPASAVTVEAACLPGGEARPVAYDAVRGWHSVNLDGIVPIVPPGGGRERQNDAIERVKLVLSNPTGHEQTSRLLLEKTGGGFRQSIGAPVTGMSAILRDTAGRPTGIPVQLSKNWHNRPEGGVHAGTWFHGFSQVRLPPQAKVELELTLAYGHWGGAAAASHAQLCLIGWGSNQLWDQSALGAWGESICYEPDQVQARCAVLDVRLVMVRSMHGDQPWHWTHNVGGGDFFRLFDAGARRIPPAAMRTAYLRQGPCLTEVTYAGRIGDGLKHSATVSLARTDDIVRGIYQLRLDVTKETDFSRFVIFQIGADTYSYTGERKMALGNESGLIREWSTQWGGGTNRTEPAECAGRIPWMSLHETVSRAAQEARNHGREGAPGAWANRGIVIRAWNARLGGKPARPWMVEHGVEARGTDTSTLDIVFPPEVTRLMPGDFVEAVFEHIVMPQFAADYYGPNNALRAALMEDENTWRMIHREAVGNDRQVEIQSGKVDALHPAVAIRAGNDNPAFTLTGGLGHVPVTFTNLASPRDHELWVDGQPVNQSIHGNDYWQTDFDPGTRRWSLTFNLPIPPGESSLIQLIRKP
jgi:hypothetical protein